MKPHRALRADIFALFVVGVWTGLAVLQIHTLYTGRGVWACWAVLAACVVNIPYMVRVTFKQEFRRIHGRLLCFLGIHAFFLYPHHTGGGIVCSRCGVRDEQATKKLIEAFDEQRSRETDDRG